jgi:PadR family transcriptional regulator PadR
VQIVSRPQRAVDPIVFSDTPAKIPAQIQAKTGGDGSCLTVHWQTGTLLYKGSWLFMETDKFNTLRKGLLEFLILGIVSAGRVYAADIMQRLSTTDFATQEGTLYPLLSKMRREQLLDYEWQESVTGPPRKYYKLATTGRKQLTEFRDYWKSLTGLIDELGRSPCKQ